MEYQSKFFNKQYLETRLREVKEIKRKEIFFEIEESDRTFSRSLYVNFYLLGKQDRPFKGHTLRISDHLLEETKCPHSQFVVDPNAFMSKSKKEQFMKSVRVSIAKAKTKHLYRELNKLSAVELEDE